MSAAAATAGGAAAHRQEVGRALLLVAVVAVAFHRALWQQLQQVPTEAPLASLGLAPVLAGVAAWSRRRPRRGEPDIEDRQLDLILAVVGCGVALLLAAGMAASRAIEAHRAQIELAALLPFTAGLIAFAFGTRSLLRMGGPLGLLALAWPPPAAWVLDRSIGVVTDATRVVTLWAAVAAGWAERVPSRAASLALTHAGTRFEVQVAQACAGTGSIVAAVVVGAFGMCFFEGGRARKLAWILAAVAVSWCVNAVRILVIVWAGSRWGESLAVEVLHPDAGYVCFTLAMGLAALLLRPLGLRLRPAPPRRHPGPPRRSGLQLGVRPASVLAVLAAAALAAGTAWSVTPIARYDLAIGDADGRALRDVGARPRVAGWSVGSQQTYPWVRAYFGREATWVRSRLRPSPGPGRAPLAPSITLDAITSASFGPYLAYPLERCYGFHGFRTASLGGIDLDGIPAHRIAYREPATGRSFAVLWWLWRVRGGADGPDDGQRFQRMALLLPITTTSARPGDLRTALDAATPMLAAVGRGLVAQALTSGAKVPNAPM